MRRVALIDRDGVIIEDTGYPKTAKFIRGAEELVRSVAEAGYEIAVITNQSGICRGILDKKTVEDINEKVKEFIAHITGAEPLVLYAPDHPKRPTNRRKPETGMFEEALKELKVEDRDSIKCVCIGDKDSDIIAGKLFGCYTVKIGQRGYAKPDTTLEKPQAIPKDVLEGVPPRIQLLTNTARMFEAEAEYLAHISLETAKYWSSEIAAAAEIVSRAIAAGKIIIAAGNGGSAADADHFVGELIGRFKKERRGLPAISGGSSLAALTAIANDYCYEKVFSRVIESFAESVGACILLSTSGNSKNIIEAVETCKKHGIPTICLLGKDGGRCAQICDIAIVVPSWSTPHIQEIHKRILHFIAEVVENDYQRLQHA